MIDEQLGTLDCTAIDPIDKVENKKRNENQFNMPMHNRAVKLE